MSSAEQAFADWEQSLLTSPRNPLRGASDARLQQAIARMDRVALNAQRGSQLAGSADVARRRAELREVSERRHRMSQIARNEDDQMRELYAQELTDYRHERESRAAAARYGYNIVRQGVTDAKVNAAKSRAAAQVRIAMARQQATANSTFAPASGAYAATSTLSAQRKQQFANARAEARDATPGTPLRALADKIVAEWERTEALDSVKSQWEADLTALLKDVQFEVRKGRM